MVVNRGFLLGQGNARSVRIIDIPAYRGMITDRNGKPLAVSTPVESVWVEPDEFNPTHDQLTQLSSLLGLSSNMIEQYVKHARSKEFVYLRRGVNPFNAVKIKSLKIDGLYLQREFRRYYPEGEVAAQLIGFTNIDDQGQEGQELAYNQWLQGIVGKKRIIRDRMGHIIADVALIRAPAPGHTLTLSIDRRIQFAAYRVLKEAVQNNQAQSGSIVVLDVPTGEVLAMVNQPSFNPNNRPAAANGRFRNRAVTDVFEPGSTIKTFSIATALASGKYTPTTVIDTNPGTIKVENKVIPEDHYRNYGILDVTGVLRKSSNVGVTKMIFSLPPDNLWNSLNKVGFGRITDATFPGESPGNLLKPRVWRPLKLATLSFGYGLNVTNLQLAQAYGVLANKGVKRPVSLIHSDGSNAQADEQVFSPKVAEQMLKMLESVVADQGGTGKRASVPGYRVGGKTGTVRMINAHGYDKDHHISVFAGVVPISNPRLVITVAIKDPKGTGAGGAVAAPVFAKIAGSALRILNVVPDVIPEADVPTNTVN